MADREGRPGRLGHAAHASPPRHDPESGMLGCEQWSGRTTMMVSYWKTPEHLRRFAADQDAPHLEPWRRFMKELSGTEDVGIWHETYQVPAPGKRDGVQRDAALRSGKSHLEGAYWSRQKNGQATDGQIHRSRRRGTDGPTRPEHLIPAPGSATPATAPQPKGPAARVNIRAPVAGQGPGPGHRGRRGGEACPS